MSAERDTTRIVRSWLRTDEHESADRVLDTVLALLDATPQRRSRWPARRIADMNAYAKLAIVAAAVLVVAVIGMNMLPAGGGIGGGPAATPTPNRRPRQHRRHSPVRRRRLRPSFPPMANSPSAGIRWSVKASRSR